MLSYFEYFGLDPRFFIDESILRKEYMRKQREWHPDFHAANPSKLQEAITETAKNNQFYNALKTFEGRVQYILAEFGMLSEGEKNTLPAAFLGEMLDINDLVDEALAGNTQAKTEAEKAISSFETEVGATMSKFAQIADTETEKWTAQYMEPMKQEFQKHRYLLRLRKNLAGERNL